MREEFPSLARVRRPTISREPLAWAFVSGLGAGPVVGGIVRVALLWAAPVILPPTQPHPEWLTTAGISTLAGAIAGGAVLTRAGGIAAIAVYLVYELLRLAAAVPGRLAFCAGRDTRLGFPSITGCDYLALVAEHWLTWVGVAIGIAVALALLRDAPGQNRLLRASGAFSLVLVVISTPMGFLLSGPITPDQQNGILAISTAGNILAGVVAGVLLAGHRLAAAVLLALLVVAPGVAFGLPLAIYDPSATTGTAAIVFVRWAGVFIPLAAAAALLLSRALVRFGPRGEGTFS